MPRINIEDSLLTSKRFEKLMLKLGSKRAALGVVVEAWIVAQRYWKTNDEGIPRAVWDREELAQELIDSDLAEDRGDFIYVRGSKDHFGWLRKCSEAGKKGGLKTQGKTSSDPKAPLKGGQASYSYSSSSSSSSSRSRSKNVSGGVVSLTPRSGGEIWEAYQIAYRNRYGVDPVRNATVNSQLAQFSKRIPADEAPRVVEFYVSHNAAFYVKSQHPVGLMLKDAESLRTQWATGRQVTSVEARAQENKQQLVNAFGRFLKPEVEV